jgi:hypothetical protein
MKKVRMMMMMMMIEVVESGNCMFHISLSYLQPDGSKH